MLPALLDEFMRELATDPIAARQTAATLRGLRVQNDENSWLIDLILRSGLGDTVSEADVGRLAHLATDTDAMRTGLIATCVNQVVYARLLADVPVDSDLVGALRRACQRTGESAALADTLAWALVEHGDLAEAERLSRIAMRSNPPTQNLANATAVHAIVLAAAGRRDEALTERAKAAELDPNCRVLSHVDRALSPDRTPR